MGYSQETFDADSPGMFQIVRMEPGAYKAFVETGRFVDGTMIALHFFGSQNEISINRAGCVSPQQYIAQARIIKAQSLIESTSLSLGDIARRCGYPSASAMRYAFANALEVTPSAYRKTFGSA